jgi:hypothetical protein
VRRTTLTRSLLGRFTGSLRRRYGTFGPSYERGERTVAVDSPVAAFAVVALGEGAIEFPSLDEAGVEVGQPANAAPIS